MKNACIKTPPLKLSIWPECPAGFDLNGLALVVFTVPACVRRSDARLLARAVLHEFASRMLDLPPAKIKLIEASNGPLLTGADRDIRISLSYAGDKVLIGLSCGRALGVDIVQIDRIAETLALSRLYLPEIACATVHEATPHVRDESFALCWAQMEACCKVLNLPLAEIDEKRQLAYASCEIVNCEQSDGYRIAVSVTPLRSTPV